MQQPGRIKSYPGALSFEVTILSSKTIVQKNTQIRKFYFAFSGTASSLPQDNNLQCSLKSSGAEIQFRSKGATLVLVSMARKFWKTDRFASLAYWWGTL